MTRKPHGEGLDDDDPVLQRWGVGKEIWAPEGGDAFIARERREWDEEASSVDEGFEPDDDTG